MVAPQRPGDRRRTVQDLAEADRQHRVRAVLDEHAVAVRVRGPHRAVQLHALAQVAVPVLAVQPGGVQQPAGDGGVEGGVRGARPDPGQQDGQPLAQRLHLRRVGGVVDRHHLGPQALLAAGRHQLLDGGPVSGDHGGGRAVDRGDAQPVGEAGDPRPDLLGRQRDRRHAAVAGAAELRDRPGPQRDHGRGVLQGERAGHVGGGDLALRVADHGVRADPGGLPERGERDHHGEQGRLHHVHPVQRGRAGAAEQHLGQRPVGVRGERLLAGRQLPGERRCGGEQFTGHAVPLGALPGEDEDGAPAGLGPPLEQPGRLATGGQLRQPVQQFRPVRTEHDGPVLEGGPREGERVAEVHRVEFGPVGHELP